MNYIHCSKEEFLKHISNQITDYIEFDLIANKNFKDLSYKKYDNSDTIDYISFYSIDLAKVDENSSLKDFRIFSIIHSHVKNKYILNYRDIVYLTIPFDIDEFFINELPIILNKVKLYINII